MTHFLDTSYGAEYQRAVARAISRGFTQRESLERLARDRDPDALTHGRHSSGDVKDVWYLSIGRRYVGRHRLPEFGMDPGLVWWSGVAGAFGWMRTPRGGARPEMIFPRTGGGLTR